eukprot:3941345-Rhodomonas_salina.2
MRCPVLTWRMGVQDGAMAVQAPYHRRSAISLRACYAMPGTELEYGPMHWPLLTRRMVQRQLLLYNPTISYPIPSTEADICLRARHEMPRTCIAPPICAMSGTELVYGATRCGRMAGIDTARLIFAGPVMPKIEHLKRLTLADLYLVPRP